MERIQNRRSRPVERVPPQPRVLERPPSQPSLERTPSFRRPALIMQDLPCVPRDYLRRRVVRFSPSPRRLPTLPPMPRPAAAPEGCP